MKKLMPFILIIVLIVLSCSQAEDSKTLVASRESALQEWQRIYDKADFHKGALKDMKKIMNKAETNLPVLVEISRLVATVPFHTDPLVHVARKASTAENANIDFYRLAELAVIKLSESSKVEDLADWASTIKADEDLGEYEAAYRALRRTADAESIEEAVAIVNEMVKKAENSASNL